MRILLMSDLHVDADDDGGYFFSAQLCQPEVQASCDVLLLSGDVANGLYAITWLQRLTRYWRKPILIVPGNHEFYGLDARAQLQDAYALITKYHPNFHVLDNNVFIHGDVRILGSTLWYPDMGMRGWSDFTWIPNLGMWLHDAANEAREFLARALATPWEGTTVVATHMLPAFACVSPKWRNSTTNQFFVHDMTSLIAQHQPRYWFYGHTHECARLKLGDTELVANPRGIGLERNLTALGKPHNGFDPRLVIEV